jgi:hypothetical protein
MSYGAGNSYNRGYENVDDKGADFDYQSYQNGFVNGASTTADENGRGGSRLFGGFVELMLYLHYLELGETQDTRR